MIPFSMHISTFVHSFELSYKLSDGVLIVFFIVCLGGSLGFLALTSRMNRFLAHPTPAPFASYDGYHPSAAVISASVCIALTSVVRSYDVWLAGIFLLLHRCVTSFLVFDCFQFPFVRSIAHPLAASVYTATVLGDILNGFVCFGVSMSDVARFATPLSILIAAFVMYYVLFRRMTSCAVATFSNKDVPSEAQRREYFDSLNLHSSKEVDRLVRIGMTHCQPMMLDFTFFVYASEISTSMTLLLNGLLFISFFLSEFQEVEHFLGLIEKRPIDSFFEGYACSRVWQLYCSRKTSHAFLQKAKNSTQDFIRCILSFWLRVATSPQTVEVSHFEQIEHLRNRAWSFWRIGCSRYSSDPLFSMGYSEYLLEGMLKIETCVAERLKSSQVQAGISSEVDPAFRQFVIARPFLVRNQLVDKKGAISRSAFEFGQSMSTTVTGQLLEQPEAEVAAGTADKVIEELFQWPHLRQLVTRATEYYRLVGKYMRQTRVMTMHKTYIYKTCLASDVVSITFTYFLNSAHPSLKYGIQSLLIQTTQNNQKTGPRQPAETVRVF
jgi:hypothetical protein